MGSSILSLVNLQLSIIYDNLPNYGLTKTYQIY